VPIGSRPTSSEHRPIACSILRGRAILAVWQISQLDGEAQYRYEPISALAPMRVVNVHQLWRDK
jgi:hypothetical protein